MTPIEIAEKLTNFLVIEKTDYAHYKVNENPLQIASFVTMHLTNTVPKNDEYPYFRLDKLEDVYEIVKHMDFKDTCEESYKRTKKIVDASDIDMNRDIYVTFKYN